MSSAKIVRSNAPIATVPQYGTAAGAESSLRGPSPWGLISGVRSVIPRPLLD